MTDTTAMNPYPLPHIRPELTIRPDFAERTPSARAQQAINRESEKDL